MTKNVLTALRALLTAAFLYYGLQKLLGAEPAVALYEALGYGQGVRYVTGSVEALGALALWIPGFQGLAALALATTVAIGFTAKAILVGGMLYHLVLLFIAAALAVYGYRHQIARHLT